MKKLMFAFAVALPLFATADTNTVSRAEFEELQRKFILLETKVMILEAQNEVRRSVSASLFSHSVPSSNTKSSLAVSPKKKDDKNSNTNAPTLLRK